MADEKAPVSQGLALVLSGGGARAAYQVGVLMAIAERRPDLTIPILTGVSAGSINAAYLGGHKGSFIEAAQGLRRKWAKLTSERVYGATKALMARSAARWVVQAVSGWKNGPPMARGVFEAGPLRESLAEALPLDGIGAKIESGNLRAVALSASSYATGLTTTFVQGVPDIPLWKRALRFGVSEKLTLDHVMASCAIPLIFPAVRLGNEYYGDGSIRQHSPLAPAVHLGAHRILAIASGPLPSSSCPPGVPCEYPTAAEAIGLLLDSVFLDTLDADAERLERINRTVSAIPVGRPCPDHLRVVDLVVVRPSRDLGVIAKESRENLPKSMTLMLQAIGVEKERGTNFLSYFLFEPGHTDRLIDLGYADASAQWSSIERLLGV